ncbi:MAG: hypothetical protein IPP19_01050 [Verrucomicrobia bacterium]|nr:hypothetical protein [Verrucomicrobiota bacterium]
MNNKAIFIRSILRLIGLIGTYSISLSAHTVIAHKVSRIGCDRSAEHGACPNFDREFKLTGRGLNVGSNVWRQICEPTPDGASESGRYIHSECDLMHVNANGALARNAQDPAAPIMYGNIFRTDQSFSARIQCTVDIGIEALALAPSGDIYVGSRFYSENGELRLGIARFRTDGTFDPAFNRYGFFSGTAAVQSDGRIVVAGPEGVVRLNLDGTLDSTFNTGTGFGFGVINSVVIQSDGRILAGGRITDFNGVSCGGIVRLNTDGSLDTAFHAPQGWIRINRGPGVSHHGGGIIDTYLGSVYDIVVQADGMIVYSNDFTNSDGSNCIGIERLNTDGTLDSTFNLGTGFGIRPSALVSQPEGKVLVGGIFTHFNGSNCPQVVRLNKDGSLDTSFHADPCLAAGSFNTIALQPDGKNILGGRFTNLSGVPYSGIVRLNANGSLDTSFDYDLHRTLGVNPADRTCNVETIALQSDGRVVLNGYFSDGTVFPRLVRLSTTGALDPTLSAPPSQIPGGAYVMVPVTDGKYIIAGYFDSIDGLYRHHFGRLNSDGSLDLSFNTEPFFGGYADTVVLQKDGKIVVGGSFTLFHATPRAGIARLTSDGLLDTSFDPNEGFAGGKVSSIVLQEDGRIIAGGDFTSFNGIASTGIVRVNTDGSLDTSFVPGYGFSGGGVTSIVLQPDGKIVVGGDFTTFDGVSRSGIARLNADGSVDTLFMPGDGFSGGQVASIALQPDGKIVVGGDFTTFDGVSRSGIARLNADGSVDTLFMPGDGFSGGQVASIALQPDGKIVAGGDFTTFNGAGCSGIVRLNANGSLDPSFFLPDIASRSGVAVSAVFFTEDGRLHLVGVITLADGVSRVGAIVLKADELSTNSSSGISGTSSSSGVGVWPSSSGRIPHFGGPRGGGLPSVWFLTAISLLAFIRVFGFCQKAECRDVKKSHSSILIKASPRF